MDYYKKLLRYHIAGVREYWGRSRETMVTVYNFESDNMEEYLFGEEVAVGIYREQSTARIPPPLR